MQWMRWYQRHTIMGWGCAGICSDHSGNTPDHFPPTERNSYILEHPLFLGGKFAGMYHVLMPEVDIKRCDINIIRQVLQVLGTDAPGPQATRQPVRQDHSIVRYHPMPWMDGTEERSMR